MVKRKIVLGLSVYKSVPHFNLSALSGWYIHLAKLFEMIWPPSDFNPVIPDDPCRDIVFHNVSCLMQGDCKCRLSASKTQTRLNQAQNTYRDDECFEFIDGDNLVTWKK